MNSATAWLIYILVVIITYFLLTYITFTNNLSTAMRLLIAFIIAAAIIFIISTSIVATSNTDKTWYAVLVVVAFVIPLILAIWIIFDHYRNNYAQEGACVIERTIQCDDKTGVCHVTGENTHCPKDNGIGSMVNQYMGNNQSKPYDTKINNQPRSYNQSRPIGTRSYDRY